MATTIKTPTTPEKTLGCRAPDSLFQEIDALVIDMAKKTGRRTTRTDVMMLAYHYGLPLVRAHIIADIQHEATKIKHQTEPERIALAARNLVNRGWEALQSDLAALPSSAI